MLKLSAYSKIKIENKSSFFSHFFRVPIMIFARISLSHQTDFMPNHSCLCALIQLYFILISSSSSFWCVNKSGIRLKSSFFADNLNEMQTPQRIRNLFSCHRRSITRAAQSLLSSSCYAYTSSFVNEPNLMLNKTMEFFYWQKW